MKRALVTGGSGFIGSQVLVPLTAMGFEVHAVSRSARGTGVPGVHWHAADLLTAGEPGRLVRELRPTHLLHLAWVTEHGAFWQAPENALWRDASTELIGQFAAAGGRRFVGAGSCVEYDLSQGLPVAENGATSDELPYARAKLETLHALQAAGREHEALSTAWGRVFHVYGPGEHPARLIPSLIIPLLQGRDAVLRSPGLRRDFLHVTDLAMAFAGLLDSQLEGAVNLSSGQAVSLEEIANIILELAPTNGMLRVEPGDPGPLAVETVVGNCSRLARELRWTPTVELRDGLAQVISWWQKEMGTAST